MNTQSAQANAYDVVGRVKVETPITKGLIGDVFVTAYESGFPWYYGFANRDKERYPYAYEQLLGEGRIWIKMEDPQDEETTAMCEVTLEGMVEALQQFVEKRAEHGYPVVPDDNWDYDACDADCVVQLACYGEVIFG